jgi:AcrR family transcriptional regulator
MPTVPMVPRSAKEEIVAAAERLFAERGIEGVSLRQIGAAAGNGNNSAVQYHYGTKDQLIQAIFEHRLPQLQARRQLLVAQRVPDDLRAWVECYVLPILEQGEQEGSHYLGFVAMLQQHGHREVFERLTAELKDINQPFRQEIGARLTGLPEPLRGHRIAQALSFSVHATAERERARADGRSVLPFAVHVADLLDGLLGFLQAPTTSASRTAGARALPRTLPESLALPFLP